MTAPNLGSTTLHAFHLAEALEAEFGCPTRVINDADMQGLAVVAGHGVELVITLGTGMGSALFSDGELQAHLELSHHPFRKGRDLRGANREPGAQANRRRKSGTGACRRRIGCLRVLTNFDHLFIGGGNAKESRLSSWMDDVALVDNANGIKGGTFLWRQKTQPD